MLKKSSVLFAVLLTSAGLSAAADNEASLRFGPDPSHVSGAKAKSAGPTGSGGTGISATGAGASQGKSNGDSTQAGQGDPSGMKYVECPGNAFSAGIRNNTQGSGTDCVPPESVVIQGSDRLSRDNSVLGTAVGERSGVGTSGTSGSNENEDGRTPAQKVEQGDSALR
jgi:hypothetical protein